MKIMPVSTLNQRTTYKTLNATRPSDDGKEPIQVKNNNIAFKGAKSIGIIAAGFILSFVSPAIGGLLMLYGIFRQIFDKDDD